jgi:protein-tyrosine phosphatase
MASDGWPFEEFDVSSRAVVETFDETSRLIEFEAVFNFRDLGGYPTSDGRVTRWRKLFRADGLNRLREDEVERFRTLGIMTLVDLRTADEVNAGRYIDRLGDIAYHHLPMFDVTPEWQEGDPDADAYLAARYAQMLASGADAVAETVGLMAEESSCPLVFHCAAGKDRTGIMAAVVLSLLGVKNDAIVADYALSGAAMERLLPWARANPGAIARPRRQIPPAAAESRPATMALFLKHIRETCGGAEGLATYLGLPANVPERLRHLLLTPSH